MELLLMQTQKDVLTLCRYLIYGVTDDLDTCSDSPDGNTLMQMDDND